jgi:adenine-specific DNA-methyltransferase
VIKYLGSKRRLVPTLVSLATSAGATTALDLFSGTARVGSALKQAGLQVTAVDSATYAHVLAETYVATDAELIDPGELAAAIAALNAVPGARGYVTEVFCERARFFHGDNGLRIDAMREEIEQRWAGTVLHPLLLTSLLEAADRVDSTTGLQMAYLKQWAPRALRPIELRVPRVLPGSGRAILGSAPDVVPAIGHVDVAYLDPPYNQHRYFTNYHVWETIVRWDAPEHYGVACKRADCRDESTKSPFNSRATMRSALAATIAAVDADLLLVSYNDESWLSADDIVRMCAESFESRGRGDCAAAVLGIDQPRYVGARIGIHNPAGERVGTVSHVRNTELVIVAGSSALVEAALGAGCATARAGGLQAFVQEPATCVGPPSPRSPVHT